MAAAKTVKARVLFDGYRYHAVTGDAKSEVFDVNKGAVIEVSPEEFKRGQEMGALTKASDKDTQPPDAGLPDNLDELSHEELQALASARGAGDTENMTRGDLIAAIVHAPGSDPTT